MALMEESENLDLSSLITAPKLTSSWPITQGSLDYTLTCESSISTVDSDLTDRKPPLILHRTSPDSPPCDITFLFSQPHEIKQVYVRSTARVYEIYYAVDERGDNEYLCTVRCGVASRIEDPAEESDGAVSLSTSFSSSNRSSCEGYIRSESGGSTNEDGWVDVKMQNSSTFGAKDSCHTKKDDGCFEQSIQDCFEATAEISDSDPVLSVTIRLLSIQSGDYVYIDEIYVFADPVVSANPNPNSSTILRETSSESSTMSLLIPTLLQMSKFRRNQIQDQKDAPRESISTNISNTSQSESTQDTTFNGASTPISQPEFPSQRLDSQNDSYSRVEKTLDELVSRVANIERFFLRFEESMVKPINNIEARLEKVEQQLESFGKTTCTRFSAPEFSGIDSESNSIFTSGNDFSGPTIESESVKKDDACLDDNSVINLNANSSCSGQSQTNDVSSSSIDVAQFHPGLVVTAPDFSSVDDEEENDPIEEVKDSPKGSFKKPVSIDDALASALSGFLLSASINIDTEKDTANILQSELDQHDFGVNISLNDALVKEESFGTDNGVICEESDTENSLGNSGSIFVNVDLVKEHTVDLAVDIKSRNIDEEYQTCIFDSSDSPSNDTSISTDSIEFSTRIETDDESSKVLTNILEFQKPVVDFAVPILDVKFLSTESLTAKSSLKTLLLDGPELSTEVSCVEENNGKSFSEQSELVMIENLDSETSQTPSDQFFCLDNYNSGLLPLNIGEEQEKEFSVQDMGASLI